MGERLTDGLAVHVVLGEKPMNHGHWISRADQLAFALQVASRAAAA